MNDERDPEEDDFEEEEGDDLLFEEEYEEEETVDETVDEESEPAQKAEYAAAPAKPVAAEAVGSQELVSPSQVGLQLSIEVGRVKMSLQQLMDLQPGNMVELAATPEGGVNLVINDKTVGRGELLRIGDTLGVRVLEKG